MDRHHWTRHISRLDPASEYEQIYRILVSHEFPWDMNQSLSFALYRTYAVPSIGHLLSQTGEFTQRTQKRYDDTALILDTVLEHGLASRQGRAAVRRMNQMHGSYPIPNDDKLYVLRGLRARHLPLGGPGRTSRRRRRVTEPAWPGHAGRRT